MVGVPFTVPLKTLGLPQHKIWVTEGVWGGRPTWEGALF